MTEESGVRTITVELPDGEKKHLKKFWQTTLGDDFCSISKKKEEPILKEQNKKVAEYLKQENR